MKKDVVIIGAGPAGIFTALELVKKGSKAKILIVEKGRAIENRRCPKSEALLSYYNRLFGRGRFFGRKTVAEL